MEPQGFRVQERVTVHPLPFAHLRMGMAATGPPNLTRKRSSAKAGVSCAGHHTGTLSMATLPYFLGRPFARMNLTIRGLRFWQLLLPFILGGRPERPVGDLPLTSELLGPLQFEHLRVMHAHIEIRSCSKHVVRGAVFLSARLHPECHLGPTVSGVRL